MEKRRELLVDQEGDEHIDHPLRKGKGQIEDKKRLKDALYGRKNRLIGGQNRPEFAT